MFSVKDNGLGIDPKYTDKIFGMFQRLHKREEFAGTGIGLAICKKIAERHESYITVESTVGVGSTFRFALTGSERT
jgi:light-regulated signal transduction histidine kinase (bacteriophytochrome)